MNKLINGIKIVIPSIISWTLLVSRCMQPVMWRESS